tara:strand:+ start:178 stop:876 length:699 start_codon:yes stop_codon:yes gene_type:complete
MNNVIFLNLSQNKISIIIYDKDNQKQVFNEDFEAEGLLSNNFILQNKLNNILKDQVLHIENKMNISISTIHLMIDDPKIFTIKISTKKNYEKNQIKKKEIEYLIQDLKQQISFSSKDLKILHIVAENFVLDGIQTETIPINDYCNDLVIEVKFICIKKHFVELVRDIFKKYQIDLELVISTEYALSQTPITSKGLLEAGLCIINRSNHKEVFILPKKTTKLGFFERIFHIFS